MTFSRAPKTRTNFSVFFREADGVVQFTVGHEHADLTVQDTQDLVDYLQRKLQTF